MRVTVLICTYGADRWRDLAYSRAYPSALGQGFFDVVCVHDQDATLAQIRNEAAAAASAAADLLVFLDADDELAPGYLDGLRAAYIGAVYPSPAPDPFPLLVPAVAYVDEQGTVAAPAAIPNRGKWPRVNECVIGTAVSRNLFLQVGGFREFPSIEDYDLWLRCFDAGAQLVYAEAAVYRAFLSRESRNHDQSPYPQIWDDHLARTR